MEAENDLETCDWAYCAKHRAELRRTDYCPECRNNDAIDVRDRMARIDATARAIFALTFDSAGATPSRFFDEAVPDSAAKLSNEADAAYRFAAALDLARARFLEAEAKS